MKKLALIYWPKGGSVEHAAKIIKEKLTDFSVSFLCVEDISADQLSDFDVFIFGGSTVGADYWSNKETEMAWRPFFAEMEQKNTRLDGKKGALLGLGNQVLYPDNFVDDMMYMKKKLEAAGLQIIGETSTDGYAFNESKAIVDDKFVGLALDEDSEPELTNQRIDSWLSNISGKL
ncbi:flavodoxin domain-containing protein [Saccharicrinis sp. FJH54]|uniref:flavodoxin domain-containing protein n=1 Tax=Saccharicrinis sp. FJH54 TaxID=3344665 RepID=UPI0035D40D7C